MICVMFIMYNHHAYFMFPSTVRNRVCWGLSDMIPQNNCINDPLEKYRKVNPTEIVLKYFNLSFWGLRKNATVLVSVVHPAIEYSWWSLYICSFFEDPNVGSIQGCHAYRVTAQKSPCRARSWEANAQDFKTWTMYKMCGGTGIVSRCQGRVLRFSMKLAKHHAL